MKNTLADINSIYDVENVSKDGKKGYVKGFVIAMLSYSSYTLSCEA